MTNFKERLLVGTTMSVIVLLIASYSHLMWVKPIFLMMIVLVTGLAVKEYYQAALNKGYRPHTALGIGGTAAYILSVFAASQWAEATSLPAAVLWIFGLLLFLHYFRQGDKPLENLAITTFGVAYLALTLGHLITITYFSDVGQFWLIYVIVVTKITDTSAYFAGKTLGNKRLAPVLSPKKTIEGSIAGIAAAVSASIAFALLLPSLQLALIPSVIVGMAIGIFAQIGDLSESLIKRDTGVKDSSHLPGLGGILDMVDSMIFTTPMVSLLLQAGLL